MAFKPTRREFVAGGIGAGMSLPLLRNIAPVWMQAAGKSYKTVVVVQLNGGNDMVNNLVNPDEPNYKRARPQVAMAKSSMVRLDNAQPWYLHPRLLPLKQLYDQGMVAMFPGIGYSPANLSHFRSMDKWATADPSATTVRTGWLGNFLSTLYQGSDPIEAMDFESRLNRVFVGHPVPVFRSPTTFNFQVDTYQTYIDDDAVERALLESNAKVLRPTAHPNLKFLADAIAKVPSDANIIQNTGSNYTPRATYPNATNFDRLLATVMQLAARYIVGGLKTPIYFMSLGGFDNHANMVDANNNTTGRHADLLGAYAGNVKAFLEDLKAWGKDTDVIVLTTSEFGRRVGENGNLGLDHGKAGIAYVAGKPVKKAGVRTAYPDWSKATAPYNRFNFEMTNDFRRLYATLIDDYWLEDSTKILGGKFASHGIFT